MLRGTKILDFAGKKITVLHNTQKASNFGSRYGQDVEPAGYYCIQKEADFSPSAYWEEKIIVLKKPLLVDDAEDAVKWKYDLSKKYSAKNKVLTKKLQKEGYDGIIALAKSGKYKGFTGEIIVFDISKSKI